MDRLSIPLRCPIGGGCNAYHRLPASHILGVPISAVGMAFFLIMLLCGCLNAAGDSETLAKGATMLWRLALGVSITLNVYGAIITKSYCFWCLSMLTLIATGCLVDARARCKARVPSFGRLLLASGSLSFALVGVLMLSGKMRSELSWRQLSAESLSKFSASQISGGVWQAGANSNRQFIAIYSPRCSGCAQSLAKYLSKLQNEPRMRLCVRFVGQPDEVDYSRTCALQALALKGPEGLKEAESILRYAESSSPASLEYISGPRPNPELLTKARSLVSRSVELVHQLSLRGFPLVFETFDDKSVVEVNPETFEVISE